MKKWILLIAGSFFFIIGIIGIFLPLLPTTPFLLLAAACYARSSERFYQWLLSNRWFGKHIRNYREGKGVQLRVKVVTLVLLWVVIGYSIFLFPYSWVKIIVMLIATGVTVHILHIPTLRE